MGFDGDLWLCCAGKFVKHIDLWDSVENQSYFSWEAFRNVLGQLGDLTRTPADLDTPSYMVLKKFSAYEIRRQAPNLLCSVNMPNALLLVYAALFLCALLRNCSFAATSVLDVRIQLRGAEANGASLGFGAEMFCDPQLLLMLRHLCVAIGLRYEPFVVAEVPLGVSNASEASSASATSGEVNPAKGGGGAFNALAGYIFGGNSRKERMAMTMPVFSDSTGQMQFVVRSSDEVCCLCYLSREPCPASSCSFVAACTSHICLDWLTLMPFKIKPIPCGYCVKVFE